MTAPYDHGYDDHAAQTDHLALGEAIDSAAHAHGLMGSEINETYEAFCASGALVFADWLLEEAARLDELRQAQPEPSTDTEPF